MTLRELLVPTTLTGLARTGVTLLALALFLVGVATAAANWHLTDLKAYREAATLLATGGNPFDVLLVERGLPYHYHYSPWFAALFVPFGGVSDTAINVGWSLVLGGASVMALVPLVRTYGWGSAPLTLLMAFLLLNLVAEGNIQPLLLAGLVWTLERRGGPVMIGVAASLKLVPIVLALVYVGRREWLRAIVAGAVTAALLLPSLLFEISDRALETGGTGLFSTAPILWALLAGAGAIATLVLARSRLGWLAAATTSVLALPRLLIFDVTNLLTALPRTTRR